MNPMTAGSSYPLLWEHGERETNVREVHYLLTALQSGLMANVQQLLESPHWVEDSDS